MQWRATLILFLLQSVCDNDFRYKREPLASRTLEPIHVSRKSKREPYSLCFIYFAYQLLVNEKSLAALSAIAIVNGSEGDCARETENPDGCFMNRVKEQDGRSPDFRLKNFGIKFSQIEGLPYRAFIHTWFNTFRSAS